MIRTAPSTTVRMPMKRLQPDRLRTSSRTGVGICVEGLVLLWVCVAMSGLSFVWVGVEKSALISGGLGVSYGGLGLEEGDLGLCRGLMCLPPFLGLLQPRLELAVQLVHSLLELRLALGARFGVLGLGLGEVGLDRRGVLVVGGVVHVGERAPEDTAP